MGNKHKTFHPTLRNDWLAETIVPVIDAQEPP